MQQRGVYSEARTPNTDLPWLGGGAAAAEGGTSQQRGWVSDIPETHIMAWLLVHDTCAPSRSLPLLFVPPPLVQSAG